MVVSRGSDIFKVLKWIKWELGLRIMNEENYLQEMKIYAEGSYNPQHTFNPQDTFLANFLQSSMPIPLIHNTWCPYIPIEGLTLLYR